MSAVRDESLLLFPTAAHTWRRTDVIAANVADTDEQMKLSASSWACAHKISETSSRRNHNRLLYGTQRLCCRRQLTRQKLSFSSRSTLRSRTSPEITSFLFIYFSPPCCLHVCSSQLQGRDRCINVPMATEEWGATLWRHVSWPSPPLPPPPAAADVINCHQTRVVHHLEGHSRNEETEFCSRI